MKNKWIIATVIVAVIAVGLIIVFTRSNSTSNVQTWQPISITAESLPGQLSDYGAIEKLPSDSTLELIVGQNHYTIKKGLVTQGTPENPDITFTLPASYFSIMGQYGWCSALAYARQQEDLGIQLHGSSAGLAWKYRALADYKKCLG